MPQMLFEISACIDNITAKLIYVNLLFETCRSCFGGVNPSEYQNICESLVQEKEYDVDRAVCTSAYGYQAACDNSKIKIDPSTLCSSAA